MNLAIHGPGNCPNLAQHCHIHNTDEPYDKGRHHAVCGECGHVWKTALGLRRRFITSAWHTTRSDRLFSPSARMTYLWRVIRQPADEMSFCPWCGHDLYREAA